MAVLIDWHAHHAAPELLDKVAEFGGKRPTGDQGDTPDFAQRRKEMDAAGIDFQLIIQTGRADQESWPAAQAIELVRTSNDAIADRVSFDLNRFGGVISVTLKDPDGSIAELDRMAARGFKAVLMYPRCEGQVVVDRPEMEPVFARIAALDLPIFIHGGGGTPKDPSLQRLEDGGAGVSGSVMNEASICEWAARAIACGLFDRYPNLRVVIRSGGGVMPMMLNRMNHKHHGPGGDKRYGEVIREHFAVDTRAPDPRTLSYVIDAMGDNGIVFGSDYGGGTFPMEAALVAIERQPDPERVKTLTERNARRLLHL